MRSSISWFSSLGRFCRRKVMKDLDAVIKRIHYVNAIVVIDLQAGRQLKISESSSSLAEVIQETALPVENLDHAPQPIHDIKMAFGIEADSFRAEHRSG